MHTNHSFSLHTSFTSVMHRISLCHTPLLFHIHTPFPSLLSSHTYSAFTTSFTPPPHQVSGTWPPSLTANQSVSAPINPSIRRRYDPAFHCSIRHRRRRFRLSGFITPEEEYSREQKKKKERKKIIYKRIVSSQLPRKYMMQCDD